jgi:hypothetical protein
VAGTDPEFLLVPQVHARLIADLDRGGQVTEEPMAFLDDRIFCVPGQVRVVELGQVVVEDARLWRLSGDDVPHRLIRASSNQVPGRKSQRSRPGQPSTSVGLRVTSARKPTSCSSRGSLPKPMTAVYHYSPRSTITASTPAASGSVRVPFQAVCCRCKASRASERCPNGAVHTLVYTDLHNGTAGAR